jgi:hypothetical protein
MHRTLLALTLATALTAYAIPAEAKGIAGAAARAATARMFARDAARDARLPIKKLSRDEYLMRYTSRTQARREAKAGLEAGRHVTGRHEGAPPLSVPATQRRYGLPTAPEVRQTWHMEKGTLVRARPRC